MFDEVSSEANEVLYTIVYSACASLCNERAVQLGNNLIDHMPRKLLSDAVVINSAIHMFMNFGDLANAERLFQGMVNKNVFTYGTMMKGN